MVNVSCLPLIINSGNIIYSIYYPISLSITIREPCQYVPYFFDMSLFKPTLLTKCSLSVHHTNPMKFYWHGIPRKECYPFKIDKYDEWQVNEQTWQNDKSMYIIMTISLVEFNNIFEELFRFGIRVLTPSHWPLTASSLTCLTSSLTSPLASQENHPVAASLMVDLPSAHTRINLRQEN